MKTRVIHWFKFASPQNFYHLAGKMWPWFAGLATVLMLAGLWTKNRTWFHAALLMVSIVFAGRIFSLCKDGWTHVATPALVIEVFIIGVLVVASKYEDSSKT